MKKKIIGFVFSTLLAGPAFGANSDPAAAYSGHGAQDEWEFSIAPYFWGAGLSGKTAQFNSPVIDLDSDFSDIFGNLDFAAMVIGEARKGRYSVFGDIMYTKLGSDNATPRGILASSVDVQASTFAGLLGTGYNVLENSSTRLDVVAALRVWSVDTDITFRGGILDGTKRSDGATWVDGLVGFRGNYAFNSKLYLMGWGMVGAGQANADWDVAIGIGYRISDMFSATIGYRAVGVDYKKGGFEFDVVQQGPMAGLVIRF